MRLCTQRSSNAVMRPSPVRHTSTGRPAILRPLGWLGGNSCDRPATYQAFSTKEVLALMRATLGAPPGKRQRAMLMAGISSNDGGRKFVDTPHVRVDSGAASFHKEEVRDETAFVRQGRSRCGRLAGRRHAAGVCAEESHYVEARKPGAAV